MYPMPTRCPVCEDELFVTRLVCQNCGSALEGRFSTGRLSQLSSDQLHFVEIFLRCEGKLNRVQQELGVSYPTVRNRLGEIVHALGYDVPVSRVDDEQRRGVLERLARKEISSEDALALLHEE